MIDINLSPYTGEQQALDRRRRMAEAMQQQSATPIDMPTMPGVRVSPYAGLAKVLQGYIAGKELSRADEAQKAYETSSKEDVARLFRNFDKEETVPGEVITPGKESTFIPENVTRYNETRNQPESFTEEERNAAIDLPLKTEAVSEVRGPSRQVPYLSADLLDPTNPNAMKSDYGKQMLMQVLMQQRAQKQAAAQAELAASRQIHKFGPEDTAGQFVNGVFKPIVTGTKQPKWEKSSTYDVNGREITGWVNTNAPDIPASFVKGATKPEMTKAQQLDLAIKLFGTRVEAQRAIDEGRVPLTFDPAELEIKPLPPQGTALQTGVVYDTPKGRFRWNGAKFISVD